MGAVAAVVAGGVVSGYMQKKAAKSAAGAQEAASRSAIDEQRRQFDITQQQMAPFRAAGVGALAEQQALLGLGLGATDPYAQQREDLQEQLRTAQARQETTRPFQGGMLAQAVAAKMRAKTTEDIAGIQAELGALPTFTATTDSAAEQQQAAFARFADSPGQQFLRDQQERSLLRNTAAIGGLGGGNVRTALQTQAFGRAQTDYQNQLNRLAALSGTGQTAATNLGQFGAQTAANIGQLQQAGGAARASGILGQQQAISRGISDVAGVAAQSGWFNQPQNLGSGTNTATTGYSTGSQGTGIVPLTGSFY